MNPAGTSKDCRNFAGRGTSKLNRWNDCLQSSPRKWVPPQPNPRHFLAGLLVSGDLDKLSRTLSAALLFSRCDFSVAFQRLLPRLKSRFPAGCGPRICANLYFACFYELPALPALYTGVSFQQCSLSRVFDERKLARALDGFAPLNAFKSVVGFREENICCEGEEYKERTFTQNLRPVCQREFRSEEMIV